MLGGRQTAASWHALIAAVAVEIIYGRIGLNGQVKPFQPATLTTFPLLTFAYFH